MKIRILSDLHIEFYDITSFEPTFTMEISDA